MGRTGSGKSHPISKSLQTNASPGSMTIEPGLFVCILPYFSASENRTVHLISSVNVQTHGESKKAFGYKCCLA